GLAQEYHDRGYEHEAHEVAGSLLVPRRHPAVLLRPAPAALRQVAVLVPLPVVRALLLRVLQRRGHPPRPPPLDPPPHPSPRPPSLLSTPWRPLPPAAGRPSVGGPAWDASAAGRGVRVNFPGRPRPLTPARTSVPNPPRLRPNACSSWPPVPSSFFARRRRG